MSNDVFIREVNEEMRQDRMRRLLARYGVAAAVAALAIVLGVGAYVLWEQHRSGVAAENGDRLIRASTLLDAGRNDEATALLQGLVADGSGIYPDLARLRLADLKQRTGDAAGALADFDAVTADAEAPQNLRDMAAVRAAYILVDTGSLADVRARAERLTSEGEPLRYVAREAVALAAWKAGDVATARPLFAALQDDLGTPAGLKRRATLMNEVIAAATPPAPPSAAPAETPVSETPAGTPTPAETAGSPSAPAEPAPLAPATEPTPTPADVAPPAVDAPAAPAPQQPPA